MADGDGDDIAISGSIRPLPKVFMNNAPRETPVSDDDSGAMVENIIDPGAANTNENELFLDNDEEVASSPNRNDAEEGSRP